MTKQDIIRKLTSRKLWTSVGSFVSMIMIYRGATESEAAQVTALIMAGAAVLGYVISEGLIDSKNASTPVSEISVETVYKEEDSE